MTDGPRYFDDEFGAALRRAKSEVVQPDSLVQFGAVELDLADAAWPEIGAELAAALPDDDAIIESFQVEGPGRLAAIGESPWLDHWRPRAAEMVATVLDALADHHVDLAFPGFLTCSITPIGLLEGHGHLDDDQYQPTEGVGVVAVSGQHVGPRVATDPVPIPAPIPAGPVEVSEATIEAFGRGESAWVQGRPDHITVLGGFGQLHAGPASADFCDLAQLTGLTHRQLMVLRSPTIPT